MSEDYFDVAWLNGEKIAILHGRTSDGRDIYRPLNDDEKDRVLALHAKHDRLMARLLAELSLKGAGDSANNAPGHIR